MSGRRGSSVGTRYKPTIRWLKNPLAGGAHNSLRVPRPDPPLLPSIIFPLGPPFCGDQCRAERALGAAEFFPVASRQVRGGGSGVGRGVGGGRGEGVGARGSVRSAGGGTAVTGGGNSIRRAVPRLPLLASSMF